MSPPRVRVHVPQAATGRDRWVIVLLLCLALVLVAGLVYNLAHLDTGGEPLPPAPGPGAPEPNFWGLLLSSIVTSIVGGAFLVLLIVAMIYALLTRKRRQLKFVARPMRWWETVGLIVAFAVLALLLYAWPRMAQGAAKQTASQNGQGNATVNVTGVPTVVGIPLGVFLILALILAIVVITVLMDLNVRLRHMVPPSALLSRRQAAAAAVQATISELQLGGDVRTSILACYQRFCVLLGARGIARQEPLTPGELETLAVNELALAPSSVGSLTALFQEARYSTHPLGEADRDRAVESLARIREALGG